MNSHRAVWHDPKGRLIAQRMEALCREIEEIWAELSQRASDLRWSGHLWRQSEQGSRIADPAQRMKEGQRNAEEQGRICKRLTAFSDRVQRVAKEVRAELEALSFHAADVSEERYGEAQSILRALAEVVPPSSLACHSGEFLDPESVRSWFGGLKRLAVRALALARGLSLETATMSGEGVDGICAAGAESAAADDSALPVRTNQVSGKRIANFELSRERLELFNTLRAELTTIADAISTGKCQSVKDLKGRYPDYRIWVILSPDEQGELLTAEYKPRAYAGTLTARNYGISTDTLKYDRKKLKQAPAK